ncbi:hypothetical protein V2F11_003668 [Acinetobacter baumannii]|uniref:hypothetical protein n=1 Tax=Acinetobacter baumannii TaxID=470 RepID=UPI00209F7A14|nr:hypothetical protein [Acinetobacter baumannii]EMF0909624.1 hypothetical protein [Acinetobacter baumannii]MCO9027065.1 hypothetical protein [Acinetobacter baumannii]
MKFFKYLIFIIITICSSSAFAETYVYYINYNNISTGNQSSYSAACNVYVSMIPTPTANARVNSFYCIYDNLKDGKVISTSSVGIEKKLVPDPPAECPEVGYPMYVYFDAGGQIPQQRCQPLGDKFCVFKAKPDSIVLNHANNRQSTVLYNVQKTPVASCTPLDAGQCDKNDPYGSCYQPPNDGCTRLADGSITCPDGAAPPSPTGTCGGATYCNRPPTGCGTGYVSGSFNGQAICVKSSPSTGTGGSDGGTGTGGEGTGTGVGTGTGSNNINNSSTSTSTSTSTGGSEGGTGGGSTTTTTTTLTIDFSPVVQAISALSQKLTWVKAEIVNAVSRVEDKLTSTNAKLDTANTKLDSVKSALDANTNSTKTAVDANTAATNAVKGAVDANTNSTNSKLNDVINAINNKPIGGGGGGSTDVTPVVDAIEKQTTDFKDMMKTDSSDFDTSQYEKIGDASDDPRYLNAQSDATNSLQSLANKLTFSSSECVHDITVVIPVFGSFTIPVSRWCELLALVKILLHLSTLMLAFRMLDSTVRAI